MQEMEWRGQLRASRLRQQLDAGIHPVLLIFSHTVVKISHFLPTPLRGKPPVHIHPFNSLSNLPTALSIRLIYLSLYAEHFLFQLRVESWLGGTESKIIIDKSLVHLKAARA